MPREPLAAWIVYPEACESVARARGARHRGPVTEDVLPKVAAAWSAEERSLWLEVFSLAAKEANDAA